MHTGYLGRIRESLRLAGLVLCLAWCESGGAQPELSNDALLEALRAGGHNIYFRHVATDWSQSDRVLEADDWLSCDSTRMRQLSAAGRAAARDIGNAIRRLQIPVGEIFASPYCRTMETARLFALGPVRDSIEVMNLRAADYFGGRAAVIASAQKLLATPPSGKGNRIIVAHGNLAREATPVYPAEGEGLVFRLDGLGGFVLLGRLTSDAWARLADFGAE